MLIRKLMSILNTNKNKNKKTIQTHENPNENPNKVHILYHPKNLQDSKLIKLISIKIKTIILQLYI